MPQAETTSSTDRPAFAPSLMAGPLHDLGARLGLGSFGLGLAMAALLWTMLVLLAAVDGVLDTVFSLSVIAGHVRILVALPLFLACEAVVEEALGPFARGLVASDITHGASALALQRACDSFNRHTASRLAEALLLLIAAVPQWLSIDIAMFGATSVQPGHPGSGWSLAGYWYWPVCLPAFRFVLLRSLFRLGVWYVLLWRISRMELNLVPTHPDRVAGLGLIGDVQMGFVLMAMATSAVVSAAIAEEIATHGGQLREHYGIILVTLLGCACLYIAPLFMFAARLWTVRLRGRAEYADLAARYVGAFDAKWLRGGAREDELLGTVDLQSLADLGNSFEVIIQMKLAPVTQEMLLRFVAAVLAPMLPLALFVFPLQELVGRVIEKLFGG